MFVSNVAPIDLDPPPPSRRVSHLTAPRHVTRATMSTHHEHPEDAYMMEFDYDENGRVRPATEDGQGFMFSKRALNAQYAVSTRLW